jgi:hypothetical protein
VCSDSGIVAQYSITGTSAHLDRTFSIGAPCFISAVAVDQDDVLYVGSEQLQDQTWSHPKVHEFSVAGATFGNPLRVLPLTGTGTWDPLVPSGLYQLACDAAGDLYAVVAGRIYEFTKQSPVLAKPVLPQISADALAVGPVGNLYVGTYVGGGSREQAAVQVYSANGFRLTRTISGPETKLGTTRSNVSLFRLFVTP